MHTSSPVALNHFMGNMFHAQRQQKAAIIAEIKVFSPAQGDLLKGRDPVDIAVSYIEGGAACISVVTGQWYGGNLEMLERIAQRVKYPILRKDFIINPKEIEISKKTGASAVLLTKKILEKDHLEELAHYACSIDLVPFIEVATQKEIEEISPPPGSVIAINNRNISIKEVDDSGISKSMNLIRATTGRGKACLYVSASGIENPEQVARLLEAGFGGVLVGSALMRATDTRNAVGKFTQCMNHRGCR